MNTDLISAVSPEELAAFRKERQAILDKAVAVILQNKECQEVLGPNAHEIISSGMSFTAHTIESIMTVAVPEMVSQQLAWGNEYLPGVGISPEMILHNFEILALTTQEILPPEDYPALTKWMRLLVEKQKERVVKGE